MLQIQKPENLDLTLNGAGHAGGSVPRFATRDSRSQCHSDTHDSVRHYFHTYSSAGYYLDADTHEYACVLWRTYSHTYNSAGYHPTSDTHEYACALWRTY